MGDWEGVLAVRRMLVFLACLCAVFTVSARALVVFAAEMEDLPMVSVSAGDAVTASSNGMMPYAYYDTYYGSISATYLEYMRGYLSKLPPDAHYVGARVGQYDYLFAYGAGLSFDGSTFSGDAVVVKWNTYNNGYMYETYDSDFTLDAGSYLVYTDLSSRYPGLATSTDMTLRQILILFTVFCLCLTIEHMYQVRKIRRLNRKENS